MAAALLGSAEDAGAWYFPEHAVIARDAVAQLPPEIQAVLEDAIARARAAGLSLCEPVGVSLPGVSRTTPIETRMLRSERGVDCVPYAALSALAGDHASSPGELRTVLTTKRGIEITSAAAFEWQRFEDALARLPNHSLERMSFVHALDVDLYFIDPGYELRAQRTHAHFVDGGRGIADVVRSAVAGQLDNSLAQFLVHHLESLRLAATGSIVDALLEHAFAAHFLQDAFAAGHLVMTEKTWRSGNEHARRRHDYFDAKGLAVGRAMAVEPCPGLGAGTLELEGLTPCWVTDGDGYLGTSPDASDRLHVARAAASVDLEFALALDSRRVVAALEGLGEREQIALGQLVEPDPWWTVAAPARAALRASAQRTMRLVRAMAHAIDDLRSQPADGAGARPSPGGLGAGDVAAALDPCKQGAAVDPAFRDAGERGSCSVGQSLTVGSVGVSLLRPLLVEWPASQRDPDELTGESKEDLGWALQLNAAANATALIPAHAPVEFFAPAAGVAGGLSYRWGTYLPGRVNRPLAELNLGISEAVQYDSRGATGGNPHVTFLDQELRWPIAWELLSSYPLPFDLAKGHEAGRLLFFSGARIHEVFARPTPALWGAELEVAAYALSAGRGSYPLYATSPELRIYVGAANPQATQPSFPSTWCPTVGIEFVGGYATFL